MYTRPFRPFLFFPSARCRTPWTISRPAFCARDLPGPALPPSGKEALPPAASRPPRSSTRRWRTVTEWHRAHRAGPGMAGARPWRPGPRGETNGPSGPRTARRQPSSWRTSVRSRPSQGLQQAPLSLSVNKRQTTPLLQGCGTRTGRKRERPADPPCPVVRWPPVPPPGALLTGSPSTKEGGTAYSLEGGGPPPPSLSQSWSEMEDSHAELQSSGLDAVVAEFET